MTIPKIIYTYWDSDMLPTLISLCIDNWHLMCPDYKIITMTPKTLERYIPDITFPKWNNYSPQHRSDYIRLYVMYHYGGIWLDASTIIIKHLSQLFDHESEQLQLTRTPCSLKYENSVIASPKFNHMTGLWLKEYAIALQIGIINYYRIHRISIYSTPVPYLLNMAIIHILEKDHKQHIKDLGFLYGDNNNINKLITCQHEFPNVNELPVIKLTINHRKQLLKVLKDDLIDDLLPEHHHLHKYINLNRVKRKPFKQSRLFKT